MWTDREPAAADVEVMLDAMAGLPAGVRAGWAAGALASVVVFAAEAAERDDLDTVRVCLTQGLAVGRALLLLGEVDELTEPPAGDLR